jgi:MFS family permease
VPYGQPVTAALASTLSPRDLARARSRARNTLVAGVALGSTGHIAAVTIATIVANDLLGSQTFAGAPGATVVLGAALGSVLLSVLMARRTRRIGLTTGYTIGVIGALVATAAVVTRQFPLLLLGTMLIGFGNTANNLSRYANADMVGPTRRASAIGIVVWASTVGSVVGPLLASVGSDIGMRLGLPMYAGAYLVPVVFVGAAAVLSFTLLRPDTYELADQATLDETAAAEASGRTTSESILAILRRPGVRVAIIALVAGQFVMVLIMTMTPLHMTQHGHSLTDVGIVLSAHTLGMYALSPLSGRLTDRFGAIPTIFLGTATLAGSAILAAVAPPTGGGLLFVALFLLGLGWNFGFVAGSALLSHHLEVHERTRVQGAADALIWSSAAAASLGSGLIMAGVGYTALGVLGAGVVIIPVVALRSHRRRELEGHAAASIELPAA